VDRAPLTILLASPAYWPARAFGGPVVAARELVRRLVERGHRVDVLTTTLVDLHGRPSARGRTEVVDGATVRYLATPVSYRWMGYTPTLTLALQRLGRPDVAHVFGFRDPVTTIAAVWCRARGIPYVFEPLGMFRPRLRKVRMKRGFDATVARGVASRAASVVVASELERDDMLAGGIAPERVVVRGNGFPEPPVTDDPSAAARAAAGVPANAPLVLSVGRIAAGKGIEHLVATARAIPEAHVVLVGPDDRHGATALVDAARSDPATAGRIHTLPATDGPPWDLYRSADVFVLASAGESFGLVAAEAAAVGTPVVVTDRCGVAGAFGEGEALVVPYEGDAVAEAVGRVLGDPALRARLADGAREAALRSSWEHVTDVQEEVYRRAAARTATTKSSTLDS
jgi:glycosyltransferase involved in cell wall biosynthesis